MKNKNKKLLLNLIVISAVALSIAPIFTSIYNTDYSGEFGSQDDPWKVTMVYEIALFYTHRNYKINDLSGNFYLIFNLYKIKDQGHKKIFETYSTTENEGSVMSYGSLINKLIFVAFGGFFTIFLYFFCYKSIKEINRKKTIFPLYAGIMVLIIVVACFFAFSTYIDDQEYEYDKLDNQRDINNNKIEFSDIRLDLGFYYLITSSILFFITYFIQSRIIDFSENTPTIEKNLFEKYKKE